MEVSESLSFAASELQTPLALLRQLTYALEYTKNQKEESELKSEIISLSDHLLSTANQLSEIKRLENGIMPFEPVCVRSLCNEVLNDLSSQSPDSEPLKKLYQNRISLAASNHNLLKNIIYNLSLSAQHFSTKNQPGIIAIHDRKKQIFIEIRDFGPSISPQFAKALPNLDRPQPVPMRPVSSGLNLYLASQFSRFIGSKISTIRHRDGVSYCLTLNPSAQEALPL
jgi:signal transduction histidine kinase